MSSSINPTSSTDSLLALSHAIAQKKGRTDAFYALDSQDRSRILRVLKISKFDGTTIEKRGLRGRIQKEIQTMTGERRSFKATKSTTNDIQKVLREIPDIPISKPDRLIKLLHAIAQKKGRTEAFNALDEQDRTRILHTLKISAFDGTMIEKKGLKGRLQKEIQALLGKEILDAVWVGDAQLIEEILDALPHDQAQVLVNTSRDKNGNTPLLNLARSYKASVACLDLLLDAGADPMLINRDGDNFVHKAAYWGRTELLKHFLNRFSQDKEFRRKLINAPDKDGNTPLLHLTHSSKGDVPCLHLLLNAGADPIVKNRNGDNFVYRAAYRGRAELLKRFLNRFSQNKEFCMRLVNTQNKKGFTPLSSLSRSPQANEAFLDLLFDAGVNLSFIHKKLCAFDWFFYSMNQKLVVKLLEKEPRIEGFFALNLLSHIFGVDLKAKISGHPLGFTGSFPVVMIEQILADLQQSGIREMYFSFCNLDQYQELIQMFQKATVRNQSAEELVEEIQSKKLVLINAGWDKHAISLVFRDKYLVICNREENEDLTFFALKIDLTLVSEEIIQKVIDLKKGPDSDAAMQYLYKELRKLLKGKNTPFCKKICRIQPKPSKTTVCTYAANKAALRAALALLTKQPKMAREASKLWATHHREWALDYFQKPPSFFDENYRKKIIKTLSKRLESRKLITLT